MFQIFKKIIFSAFVKKYQNNTSELVLRGQKLEKVALNHFWVVLCLEKFLFWPFWSIYGQKYIVCGDKMVFLTVFSHFQFFMFHGHVLFLVSRL